MKIPVYNQTGEKVSETLLPKEVFDVKLNADLVWQVATAQLANRRVVIADTKDRSEVRGGGRKPWRQKGTGRARAGSLRSPLFKGGGTVFGPQSERNFKQKINKKVQRKALFMTLSGKARDKELIVLEELKIEKPKTKEISALINNLKSNLENLNKGAILIALPKSEENLVKAARNIEGIKTIEARNLNVLDLLNYKYVLMPKESIKAIEKTFLKSV